MLYDICESMNSYNRKLKTGKSDASKLRTSLVFLDHEGALTWIVSIVKCDNLNFARRMMFEHICWTILPAYSRLEPILLLFHFQNVWYILDSIMYYYVWLPPHFCDTTACRQEIEKKSFHFVFYRRKNISMYFSLFRNLLARYRWMCWSHMLISGNCAGVDAIHHWLRTLGISRWSYPAVILSRARDEPFTSTSSKRIFQFGFSSSVSSETRNRKREFLFQKW